MVTTKVQLVPTNRRLVSAGKNNKRGVTVHETGNKSKGAGAQAHANLQSNGNNRAASWHWQVDDKIAIQSYYHNDRCWHGGHPTANADRIAVEICVNEDSDFKKAVENAAWLVATILKNEGLTPNDVDQHASYPQNQGRPNEHTKNCPAQLRGGSDGYDWNDFKRLVNDIFYGQTGTTPERPAQSAPKPASTKTVAQVAQEVIDGKWGNDPERTQRLRAAGFNPSTVQAEVNRRVGSGNSAAAPARQTLDQVARDVINGKYGNEPQRSQRLRAAGHNPGQVQQRVNRLWAQGVRGNQNGSSQVNVNARLSVDQVARQIVNGQGGWGNDPERSRNLRAAGYDPAAVQRRVNQLL